MKFRKKPVVIEAVRVPDQKNGLGGFEEMKEWLYATERHWALLQDGGISIHTLEGTMRANPGDWIIKGIKGEIYPCKPDIFEATYEAVEEEISA